jgi:hypothetical protein
VRWLDTDVTGHRVGIERERECQVDLDAGQEFRIEIANNHTVDVATSLVIRELRGVMVSPK